MPKIETEEQFLDLAEKFQKDYCLLRNHVVNTQFVDLSDDLREKAHALNKEAQQIYGYISSSIMALVFIHYATVLLTI